jgi:glycosyltransferase involved in cell wall biosynthesis
LVTRGENAAPRRSHAKISVVVPVYDEQGSLDELVRRVITVVERLPDVELELILVDDGSKDASLPLMLALARRDQRLTVVELSRNFGHQVALTAGIELASGDAVVLMDADLQHPPELIEQFTRLWREGNDVVYGVMVGRPEGLFKRITARLYYRFLNRLTTTTMPRAAGDFRLIDRVVVDSFLAMRERDRYLRGMFAWLGFRQVGVEYVPAPRYAGGSKYTFGRMVTLAVDGILSFSIFPLRIVIGVGLVVSVVSFLFGIASGVSKFVGVFTVPGWATLVVVTTFIGGVQLIVLGGMAEYIGRVYEEVKRRPLYVVRRLHRFEAES